MSVGGNEIQSTSTEPVLSKTTRQTIKELAEHAMNELLGWYGYTKVEGQDGVSSCVQRFSDHSPPPAQTSSSPDAVQGVRPLDYARVSSPSRLSSSPRSSTYSPNTASLPNHNSSPARCPSDNDHEADSVDSDMMRLHASDGSQSISPSRQEVGSTSSRESTPKSDITSSWGAGGCGVALQLPQIAVCCWCKRLCEENSEGANKSGSKDRTFPLTSGDKFFCSDLCFTQSRRASFKKSKICDWCRHVRSTVSYVDFTDGGHQLQFCSDRCLVQYKMHIFCRETEAHLQLHPHLVKPGQSNNLITPDLWMKECSGNKLLEQLGEKPNDHEEMALENGHDQKGRSVSPSTASRPSVSPESMDLTEPVNLTIQNAELLDHGTKNITGKSPLVRIKSKAALQDLSHPHSSRTRNKYRVNDELHEGRLRNSSDPDNLQCASPLVESSTSEKSNDQPKIRIRQLEQAHRVAHEKHMSVTPPQSPAHTPLPVLSTLEGLLAGSQNPLVPGVPHVLPPPPAADLSRPPLFPHLLLTHPELLRLPGLRPPLLLPQPPQHPIGPHITTPIPQSSLGLPSLPRCPSVPNASHSKPSLFPPVTVLLPIPIPVPVPVPIPIPIPFPIKVTDTAKNCEHLAESKPDVVNANVKTAGIGMLSDVHNHGITDRTSLAPSKEVLSVSREHLDHSTTTTRLRGDKKKDKLVAGVPWRNIRRDIIPPVDNVALTAEVKGERERRSILRYTSDVYEINGVFVPREGSWEKLSQLQSTLSKYKDDNIENSSESSLSKEELTNETGNFSQNHKRRAETNSAQPVPKKKHILT